MQFPRALEIQRRTGAMRQSTEVALEIGGIIDALEFDAQKSFQLFLRDRRTGLGVFSGFHGGFPLCCKRLGLRFRILARRLVEKPRVDTLADHFGKMHGSLLARSLFDHLPF